MRTITLIIIHCSAVTETQQSRAADIDRWHRARGWKGIGYHFVIRRDGAIELGRPVEQVGAHCKNHNLHSIGICYEGGLITQKVTSSEGKLTEQHIPADTRTQAQKRSLSTLIDLLHYQYPHALVVGHHDLDPTKSCPCFDVYKEYPPAEG